MSLLSQISALDIEGVKWSKLQRWIRATVDNAGISYALAYPLTDILPGDTEGVKWAKLGAWVKLLADNIGSVSGAPGGNDGDIQFNDNGVFGGIPATGTGDVVRSIMGELEGFILTGAEQVDASAIVGTEIDVTLPETTVSLTSSPTLTFSATPTAGTQFRVTLNADSSQRTVTSPSSYSVNRQGNITSVVVPASGTVVLLFRRTASRWEVFGDPVYGFSLGPSLGDGEYTGITEPGVAGAALAFGDLCYLNNDDSRWELVDANLSDGYNKKLGICVQAAASDGDATTLLLIGKIRADSKFPTLTVGAPAYMSETAGAIVVTAPSTSGAAVRIAGFGNTADELYFNPSPDTIVLT